MTKQELITFIDEQLLDFKKDYEKVRQEEAAYKDASTTGGIARWHSAVVSGSEKAVFISVLNMLKTRAELLNN